MTLRFFDHNATTPLFSEAKAAWSQALDDAWLNPSSPYRKAAAVRVRLEDARARLGGLIRVRPERVIFNSGATEGNNAVFAYWAKVLGSKDRIAVSPVEHPSVLAAAEQFFADRIEWLPVSSDGVVGLSKLETLLKNGVIGAVSVMAANNETGICQPWEQVAELCAAAKCSYHCDASQWIGKLPAGNLSNCDFITGCGHKFGGPRGVGFLVLPSAGADSFSGLVGGAQEGGFRAGTEDVPAILSMVTALEVANSKLGQMNPDLRDAFIADLSGRLGGQFLGDRCIRLWNTVAWIAPEFRSARWIAGLERRGFLVSAGSACSTGKAGPSHVLAAMGVAPDAMQRVLRISSGWETSAEDWAALSDALVAVYEDLKEEAAGESSKVISI